MVFDSEVSPGVSSFYAASSSALGTTCSLLRGAVNVSRGTHEWVELTLNSLNMEAHFGCFVYLEMFNDETLHLPSVLLSEVVLD